jgi:two-component system phosphate regulon response regulator PhoB
MNTVLLVEDDISLGATLVERLERERYQMRWARSVAEAERELAASPVQLAILDVGLPDGSGFDLARRIRATSATPIIFLTAMNSAENRLEGYEIGADEFIPKPFHLKELILRIQRVLSAKSHLRSISSGEVTVNYDSMTVVFPNGHTEYPATRDFKLLQLLIESSPQVVSRMDVLRMIFPDAGPAEELPTGRTIDNSISRLRQMLRQVEGEYIRSVRGVGYQWIAPK